MNSTVLAIEHLHADLHGPRGRRSGILRDVSLEVEQGEVHGLVGESGAGKSMVAKAVLGILPNAIRISEGSIRFEDRELVGLGERAYREMLGRDISLIPQDPLSALNPARRIDAQMTDVMRLHMGWDRKRAQARALELLEEVHIRDPKSVLRRYPHELSGGMRQRILIATAFACEPKLIIADEPTTALDVTVQKQILRLLREMQRRHGTAILFVTHDLGVVAKVCGSLSVIHSGMIVEQGATAGILAAPQHPFTQALFSATPRYDRPADALAPVPVEVVRALEAEAQAFDRRRHEAMS
jgi:peptide/nickel transport system ATP-binding protein